MAHKIYVNENEIKWMKKLVKEGKSIKEIAKEVHRSETTVKKFTKELRAKMREQSGQIKLDIEEATPFDFKIGEVNDMGMVEIQVGRSVTYITKDEIVTLVQRLIERIDKLEGGE